MCNQICCAISEQSWRWNSPFPKPLGHLLCFYWPDNGKKRVYGLVCSLCFGSEPQLINYSQIRMFKEPDLELTGENVQDTWNTPHRVQLIDCQWLSEAAEWLALVPRKQHCSLAQFLIADQGDCQQEWIHFHHSIGRLTSLGSIQNMHMNNKV